MNPPARKNIHVRQSATAAAILGAGGLMAACVGNPLAEAQVNPASPVAAEVAKAAHANPDFPSFNEIPPVPNDVRPLRLYGQEANDLKLAAAELERATAPGTWALTGDTEAFAARARTEVGPDLPAANPADTEAYANELRKRATPPPPPKR
jgi:hypothetical protein